MVVTRSHSLLYQSSKKKNEKLFKKYTDSQWQMCLEPLLSSVGAMGVPVVVVVVPIQRILFRRRYTVKKERK